MKHTLTTHYSLRLLSCSTWLGKASRSTLLNAMKAIVFMIFFPTALHAQDSFMVVGIHPGASAQNTVTGKQIATLFPWKGNLYAGYGDYGANTGPIDIYAFDPDSQKFTFVWEANTEAIYIFKEYNGRVYAPAIDRKSYSKPGDYTLLDTNGVWGDYNFGSNSTHVYDVARLNDEDIFMVGSQEERATVWHSDDNGTTWKKIHTDTALGVNPEDFARYYFAGVLNDKLYVQARGYYSPLHPYSETWDGVVWEKDTSVFGTNTNAFGSRTDTFAGKMVLMSAPSGPNGYSSLLRTFDGVTGSTLPGIWVFDFLVDSNYLYALVDSGFGTIHVKRTTDLINWHILAKAPYGVRSLAIMDDKMYIGMNDSRIMEYTRSISDIVTWVEKLDEPVFNVFIFPNPCMDVLHLIVPWNGRTTGSIVDLSGSVVRKWIGENREATIDVSNLSTGMYVLKLESAGGVVAMNFFKK